MAKPKKAPAAASTAAQPKPTITQVPGKNGFTLTAEWAWYWVPIFIAAFLCLGGMIATGFFMHQEKPEPLFIGAAALVCTFSIGSFIPLALRQAPGV